jgi:hypothetical protein
MLNIMARAVTPDHESREGGIQRSNDPALKIRAMPPELTPSNLPSHIHTVMENTDDQDSYFDLGVENHVALMRKPPVSASQVIDRITHFRMRSQKIETLTQGADVRFCLGGTESFKRIRQDALDIVGCRLRQPIHPDLFGP